MAKTGFDACLDHVLAHEGGYADHPADPGGATNMGITRKTLARWRKVSPWWNLPKTAVKTLHRQEAAQIYRSGYWDACRAETLPRGLDLALFDFAVNSGAVRAIKTLQAVLNVKADGRFGPLTRDALKQQLAASGTARLIDALCDRRLNFLQHLGTFLTFGRGWTTRVAAIRRAAKTMAGDAAGPIPTSPRSKTMDILNGYKTYIVATLMLLAGIAQVLGLDIPNLDGNAAGNLIMEALAVLFLRKGFKTDISRA